MTTMGRMAPLLTVLLVVVSIGIMPGTAVAADDWPDNCGDAPIVDATGDHDVRIDTPDDWDYLRLRLEKGDYIHVSTVIPEEKGRLVISSSNAGDAQFTMQSGTNVKADRVAASDFVPGVEASWEMWAEGSGTNTYCLSIIDDSDDKDVPYEFTLKMRLNSPEPASFESTQSQSELEQKEQRIQELESQLEQKEQRIQELEARVNELESQSGGGNGDVTIDVTVTPANGQQNFIQGGKALVQAESASADVSKMVVEFGAGTYELDSSGEVAVPLAETGTQEMTFVYGDTIKKVSIEVQPEGGQSEQNQQEDSLIGVSGPGFGVIASLIALFVVVALLRN